MPRAFAMFVQCLSHLSHFALTRRTRVTRVMQPGSASCRWPRCKTLPGTRPGPCKLRCAWPPGRKWRIRTSEHQNLWVLSTLCGNHAVTNKTSENWYENMCEFMRIPSRSTTCRPLSKYQNMAWSTRILLSTEKKNLQLHYVTMSLCCTDSASCRPRMTPSTWRARLRTPRTAPFISVTFAIRANMLNDAQCMWAADYCGFLPIVAVPESSDSPNVALNIFEIIEVAASSSFSGSGAMVSSSSSCSAMACEFTSKAGKSGKSGAHKVALKYLRTAETNLKKVRAAVVWFAKRRSYFEPRSPHRQRSVYTCPATRVVNPNLFNEDCRD